MYDLFFKNTSIEDAFLSIEKWKKEVFSIVELEVKKYFAEKVIVYFDNYMFFKKEMGFHNNLMEALAISTEEMMNAHGVFKDIALRWISEGNEHFLLIKGLRSKDEKTLSNYGFSLIDKNIIVEDNKREELNLNSWFTIVFNLELVNFSKDWFKHIPELERRSHLQTEYILTNTQFNKVEMTLLEKIKFEKEIKNHNSYNVLYNKIIKVMPKMQSSLMQEYKDEIYKDVIEQQINKNKLKI